MSANSNHLPPQTADLYWESFRYFSGEMNTDEQGAFEARLADDQQAREALAEMVSLVGTVRAAASVEVAALEVAAPTTSDDRAVTPVARGADLWPRLRQRAGWAALGMAASLALLLAYERVAPQMAAVPNQVAAIDPTAAQNLALAWYHSAGEAGNVAVEDPGVEDATYTLSAAIHSSVDEHDLPAVDAVSRPIAPAWLVTAIRSETAPTKTEEN